ncbi:MAG TPA: dihydroorotase [Gammaproteobacteria bacterium]|nr:dihydroorotase [Gammaproteobacteria bacterium]|tara:strand:- start:168 stop:1223 length:1056 start_codon:yes stop_codon:yes gene_type:complete
MSLKSISIPRPDDWHLHLRDDSILAAVLPNTARIFGRAIVMPNLRPAVCTARAAVAYRSRIEALIPEGSNFTPLMTAYLTDATDPLELRAGWNDGIFSAAKLYPAGATTNAEDGITDILQLDNVFEMLQELSMPLLIHGETMNQQVDIFDREAVFIEDTLLPLRQRYPAMRIIFEHITTNEAVAFVEAADENVAATITPHHLMLNRNDIFKDGLRPHYYCLPVAKREHHRRSLRVAATSGNPKFFLGTDSAPHLTTDKESDCGCAGVYNAATAMSCYTQVFDEEQSLDKLAGFASHHGPDFYHLPRNTETITLTRAGTLEQPPDIDINGGKIRQFLPETPVHWHLIHEQPQ